MRQQIAVLLLAIAPLVVPREARAAPDAPAVESSRGSRIALEAASSLAAAGATVGVAIGAGFRSADKCSGENGDIAGAWGCSVRGSTILLGVGLALVPGALSAGTYLPHRARGGRGRWWTSVLGTVAGLGAGTAALSAAYAVGDESRVSGITGSIIGGVLALTLPVVAVEWSHSRRRRMERRVSQRRRSVVNPMASALPGGGAWLGLVGTL